MKYPNNFFLIMAALFGVSRDAFESYPVELQSFLCPGSHPLKRW